MESNYFYSGIPLLQYCREHGIKYNTIIKGISRKRNHPKFKDYSEQEIVNMCVENYGTSIKYTYKGISLRQYCIENDLSIETLYTRISQLKIENSNLTNEELVRLSIEEFESKRVKYYYKGESLFDFCKRTPNLSYYSVVDYIHRKKEDNPTLDNHEIIELYLNENHGQYRYYYQGVPFKLYCDRNDINYENVMNYISRHRKDKDYIDLSDDELIENIMLHYQPFKPKYMYKSVTLYSYCKKKNLPYYSIVSYINSKCEKNKSLDIERVIDEAIITVHKHGIIYYYNGIPLKDYCLQNGLNIHSIRGAIWEKKRKNSDIPLQEIVNECVEAYQKNNLKYFYREEPLIQFCDRMGISYNTIVNRYLKSEGKSMESIVNHYMSNPINRRRYYFDNMTLSKFCSQNGYSYFAIYQRIKRLENQEKYDANMDTIKISIEEYAKKLHIKDISDTFKNLENMKFYNSDEIKNICHFLKIDYDCVLELIEMDFSYVQAINMIWYFGDSKNEVDDKIITNQKIEILFSLVDQISKATNIDIDKFLLYDLIGLYKCKLYDTRSEILMKQRKHIHHIVYYMCDAYGIKAVNSIVDDFSSEVKLIFLEIINNICLNTEGQMVKYIDLTLKGNLRRYIERYQRNIPITSLDEPLFSNEKTKTRIDYIADYKKQPEASEDAFGNNMLEALSNLTTEDLSFIMLKYQENYTDEELGEYFKMDIEEIKQKEVRILSSLRNNPNVQNLEKNYKKSFVP